MQRRQTRLSNTHQMDFARLLRLVVCHEVGRGERVLDLQTDERLSQKIGEVKRLPVAKRAVRLFGSRLTTAAEIDRDNDKSLLHQFFDLSARSAVRKLAVLVK